MVIPVGAIAYASRAADREAVAASRSRRRRLSGALTGTCPDLSDDPHAAMT